MISIVFVPVYLWILNAVVVLQSADVLLFGIERSRGQFAPLSYIFPTKYTDAVGPERDHVRVFWSHFFDSAPPTLKATTGLLLNTEVGL